MKKMKFSPSSAVVVDETTFDRHSSLVPGRLSASEAQQMVLTIVLPLSMLLGEQVQRCLTIEFDEEMVQ